MALINCPECNASISDKAGACPQCGAPNDMQSAAAAAQSTTWQGEPAAAQGSTACPFSGHAIPAGATVCVCGAYYGYKGGVLDDQKFKLLIKLLGISFVVLLLGFFFEWQPVALIGFLGALIFSIVFLFFVLPIRLQGKKWWRQM